MNNLKYAPLLAFCLYFGKLFLQVPSYQEATILFILSATCAYFQYKNSDPQIKALENSLTDIKKDLENKTKDLDNLKSSVAGMKLGNSMRPVSSGR